MGPGYYDLYYGGFSPLYYIAMLALLAFSLYAQIRVKTSFSKYSAAHCRSGMTGAQAAQAILRANGITDVRIEPISGDLTDHYDPKNKVLRLSDSTYGSASVAAVGVAAHECGHAIQHATNYAPLSIRGALVPVANFGAQISWPLIIIGLLFNGNMSGLFINLGILLFSCSVLFQIVTLPVEFNASSRALRILDGSGLLDNEEVGQARKVLSAAALTYVAGAAASILQLLRLLILTRGRRDD